MSSVQNIWLINILIRVIHGSKGPVKETKVETAFYCFVYFKEMKFESGNVHDSKSRNVHSSIFIFFFGGGGGGGG